MMEEHTHASEQICGECGLHHDVLDKMLENTPDAEIFSAVAALLGLFGDPTRVRILFELLKQELCVGDIAQRLGMTSSAISHQLRILKQGRLVRSRREGKTVFYSLADSHVKTIFCHALEHVTE